ncbi:MAG: coenzyme A pyrophosphatase [Bacteroidia bacterium]|nr:MAG: coenzyme A pyrophosphatase [Bacteroidia bacterium]
MNIKQVCQYLKSAELPGISAHKEMSFTNRNFEKPSNAIPSAVCILLYENNQQIFFPLIKRTANSLHHKGQIALPGGRLDPDEDIEHCAVRECEEEIGISRNTIIPIRRLTELYIPVSNHIVYPIICYTTQTPTFHFNPDEVEKILFCSIIELIRFKKQLTKVRLVDNLNIDAPAFIYQNEIIWGATALILNEFKQILIQNSFFDNF